MKKERQFDNFDEFAEEYRNIHNENIKISGQSSDYFSRQKIEIIHSHLSPDDIKFLDFGCGDGNTESFFYEFFPNSFYSGIDVSLKSIEIANSNKQKKSFFCLFDGVKLPFADETFDIIVAANVFHHIDYKYHENLFFEIKRVLKNNASFYLFEHNPWNPITKFIVKTCPFDADAKLLTPNYSLRVLKKLEFSQVKISYINFFPRNKLTLKLLEFENRLQSIPFGCQYYVNCLK